MSRWLIAIPVVPLAPDGTPRPAERKTHGLTVEAPDAGAAWAAAVQLAANWDAAGRVRTDAAGITVEPIGPGESPMAAVHRALPRIGQAHRSQTTEPDPGR